MRLLKPPALKPKDTVAIVAPSGWVERASFEPGLALLKARYDVRIDDGVFAEYRYLAGNDDRRFDELAGALAAPEVKAIFVARGGYGAMRLLPRIDFNSVPPKWWVGFSDITAFHSALLANGQVSIHGPVVRQLGYQPPEVAAALFSLLEEPRLPLPLKGAGCLVPGVVEGPLVGGNLSVLTRLLGTPYLPPLEGAVLLLEDVGERPYRLDRMWTHLKLAGVFQKIAGIMLGDFNDCEEAGAKYSSIDVLTSLAQEAGLPCARGFPVGHDKVNWPVPLGLKVRLDATHATLSFLEGAVA